MTPQKYTMDHSMLILSIQKEESISIQRDKEYRVKVRQEGQLKNTKERREAKDW